MPGNTENQNKRKNNNLKKKKSQSNMKKIFKTEKKS